MTNHNINLPSKRAENQKGFKPMSSNEVEHCLRRKTKKEWQPSTLILITLSIIVATLAYFIVAKVTDDQAQASTKVHSALCNRYLNDSSLNGTSAEETLKSLCSQ